MSNKICLECKHLQKSVYMVLEDETLYNYWCKVGDVTNSEECDKFELKQQEKKKNVKNNRK